MLRAAGKRLLDLDEAYALKLGNLLGGDPNSEGNLIRKIVGHGMGGVPLKVGPLTPTFSGSEPALIKALGHAGAYGIPALNAGVRYGIPAAGVTAAGFGLYELSQQFGGEGDQQEPGQLPLY